MSHIMPVHGAHLLSVTSSLLASHEVQGLSAFSTSLIVLGIVARLSLHVQGNGGGHIGLHNKLEAECLLHITCKSQIRE